ncbi:MAG: hypothetical protein CK425_10755 [Parachlamydia sp.]|nr:MAG: hypothetical protein CK425_10755 [Parachlamydia sp.]
MGAYDPCFYSVPTVTVLPEVNNFLAPEVKAPEVYGGNNPYDPWTSHDEMLRKVQASAATHFDSPSNTQPPVVHTPKVPIPPSSTKHNNFDIKPTGAEIDQRPKEEQSQEKEKQSQKKPPLLLIV